MKDIVTGSLRRNLWLLCVLSLGLTLMLALSPVLIILMVLHRIGDIALLAWGKENVEAIKKIDGLILKREPKGDL